jgi:hypothetical protein
MKKGTKERRNDNIGNLGGLSSPNPAHQPPSTDGMDLPLGAEFPHHQRLLILYASPQHSYHRTRQD